MRLLIKLAGLWVRRDLLIVDVDGRSMEPTLHAGDRLLCSRRIAPWLGAIVLRQLRPPVGAPYYQIKRLMGLAGDRRGGGVIAPGFCWLEGDNKEASGDSRAFGAISADELVAVAVARLRGNRLDNLAPRLGRPRRWTSTAMRGLGEIWGDWGARVQTRGTRGADSFGYSPAIIRPYVPTPWSIVRRALDELDITESDSLLDYGCGKGRVLVTAQKYPFRRIIGVEIVPELVAIARKNLDGDRRCEVYRADAADFVVPDDVTVVYLFNPFDDAVHSCVARQIAESLRRAPRRVRVVTFHVVAEWLRGATSTRSLAPNLVLHELGANLTDPA